MALIKCPECGKEISDKAQSCINCGCPICKQSNSLGAGNSENIEDGGKIKISVRKKFIVAIVLNAFAIFILFIAMSLKQDWFVDIGVIAFVATLALSVLTFLMRDSLKKKSAIASLILSVISFFICIVAVSNIGFGYHVFFRVALIPSVFLYFISALMTASGLKEYSGK